MCHYVACVSLRVRMRMISCVYESVSVCVCVFAYALQNKLTPIFSISIYSNRAGMA